MQKSIDSKIEQPKMSKARVIDPNGNEWDSLKSPGVLFNTLYVDPPYEYDNIASRGAASRHYSTMSREEILALPVDRIAALKCHLFLWVPNNFLEDGLDLIRHWGFAYVTNFVWAKSPMGLGNYFRNSHAILLYGQKGRRRFRRYDVKSWIEIPRTCRHSEKPAAIRNLIESVSYSPRLEMFARYHKRGGAWWAWGNEIEEQIDPKTTN